MATEARQWVLDPVTGLWVPAPAAVQDYDTGAGTVNQTMFGIAIPGAGGPVPGGTATNPLVVDTELPAASALADAEANPTTPRVGANALSFNGATWDRRRNNETFPILALLARSATVVSPLQTNYNARGVAIKVQITAIATGGDTLGLSIHMDDIAGAASYAWYSRAAMVIDTYWILVYPGITVAPAAAQNTIASMAIPRRWHVYMTPSAVGVGREITYEVEGCYIQ